MMSVAGSTTQNLDDPDEMCYVSIFWLYLRCLICFVFLQLKICHKTGTRSYDFIQLLKYSHSLTRRKHIGFHLPQNASSRGYGGGGIKNPPWTCTTDLIFKFR